MSTRYLGGIIRKTPLVLDPALGNAANGVFTLNQYMQAVKNATWPGFDPYFNQTVLSLHGNGTSGDQNNTFLDGSTNNFTITRNGNTTQGTFSPFSLAAGEWSNYFDGNGDYLTFNSSTVCNFGTGDFTISCWVYLTSALSAAVNILDARASASTVPFVIGIDADEKPYLYDGTSSLTASDAISVNNWNHLSFVRSSGTLNIYINAVSKLSTAMTVNISSTATAARIGGNLSNSNYFPGYISNFLIEKGTASPPSSVPTSPYVVDANTDFLSCQSNRFVDNSTNAFAITANGDVRVTPFSPFAPTAAYSAGTNGGSGYFDGTGDYLSIADAAGLRFGTGNFTIQCWIYRNAAGAVHSIAAKGGASTGWVFQVHSDNKLRFTHTTTNIDSTGTIPASAWTHVAVVREGTGTNQVKLYINGVNDGQGTVSTDFTQTEQLNIGADRGNSNVMNGYIAGWKYVVGTAETITVPTAPPTGGTALLNFTNAGIFDNTGKNNLETVADAQIDTTTKKYGTGSMEFDGTGDVLVIPFSPFYVLGTENFTVESWVYFNALNANNEIISINSTGSSGYAAVRITANSSGALLLLCASAASTWINTSATANSTVATGAWYHIAGVRNGSTFTLYVDGVSKLSYTSSAALHNASGVTFVGAENSSGSPVNVLNGYIDDLRITKGVARYTANFTAQTSQWQDQ